MGSSSAVGQGFYSLVRYRADPARDEARNLAVVLVGGSAAFAEMRAAPVSHVSPSLHDQGIVDALLNGLSTRLHATGAVSIDDLAAWSRELNASLVVTSPSPTAIVDSPEATLTSLYKALVQPRLASTKGITKGRLLDSVVNQYRSRGAPIARGAYVGDFLFDAVIADKRVRSTVLSCLSFDRPRKDWSTVEKDAGHYLYGVQHVDASPLAIIIPPDPEAADPARIAYERVGRWLSTSDVPVLLPTDVPDFVEQSYGPAKQLALTL